MLSLATSDLIQACVGYTLEMNSLVGAAGSTPSRISCSATGFVITFMALVSIFHFTGLSIERYVMLAYPLRSRDWLRNRWMSLYIIIPSWIMGFLWALFPLIGWSSYQIQAKMSYRCSIDLSDETMNTKSFSYCILFFCFIMPLGFIAVSSTWTCREMRLRRVAAQRNNNTSFNTRRNQEVRNAVLVFALIAVFLLAWSPYAVYIFSRTLTGLRNDVFLSVSMSFAKSSTLYNPVIYLIFLKEFRAKCARVLRLRPEPDPGSTVPTIVFHRPSNPQCLETDDAIKYFYGS